MVLICTMGKEIGRSFKYNRSKISTSTLKEPVVSSSTAHTSSASNLTRTSISSQLDNKDITTNQSKNNISNTDDIPQERKKTRVSCKECGDTMAASSLRHHTERAHVIVLLQVRGVDVRVGGLEVYKMSFTRIPKLVDCPVEG